MRKKFMRKKSMAVLLAAAMASSMMAGCGSSGQSQEAAKPQETQKQETAASETAAQETAGEFTYPMTDSPKLTYWCELNTVVSPNFSNLGDTPFGKNWMEKTGAEIEFMHPPLGQLKEQFSLVVADGNLPDLMEYNWIVDYPGGPEKAIKDGVIISLNDVFEKYCPNITKYLQEHPNIDKMVKTDDGNYFCFPFIRGDDKMCYNTGLMLRKDWLDELGLEVPKTIDDWHTVLTAFKEKKGSTAPYTFEYTNAMLYADDPFVYAFGIARGFYIADDGTVHYGAAEEEYKQYLELMRQWHAEKLIDPDLATMGFDQVNAKMTNGTSGASVGWAGGRIGVWTPAARVNDPNYTLVPAPYPTINEGDYPEFGQKDNPARASVAITTSCKDVEHAARLMDWGYSEEGHMAFNFGVEGESYEMIDGYPTYTDFIMKNPNGLPISQAMGSYIRGNYNGPFVQDLAYLEQYYTLDEQKQTIEVWGGTNAGKHILPPITPTSEESKEFAALMNEINTYRDEMTLKFILGTADMSEFDTYVNNLKTMGIDRALEIENGALERYNAR